MKHKKLRGWRVAVLCVCVSVCVSRNRRNLENGTVDPHFFVLFGRREAVGCHRSFVLQTCREACLARSVVVVSHRGDVSRGWRVLVLLHAGLGRGPWFGRSLHFVSRRVAYLGSGRWRSCLGSVSLAPAMFIFTSTAGRRRANMVTRMAPLRGYSI